MHATRLAAIKALCALKLFSGLPAQTITANGNNKRKWRGSSHSGWYVLNEKGKYNASKSSIVKNFCPSVNFSFLLFSLVKQLSP